MKSPMKSLSGGMESGKYHWKRRPSEIRGYNRTLYLNSDAGDYLRVDYNTREKRVRLYIEDAGEGGIPYYAIINNGKVTAEKNAQTGRPIDLSEKIGSRADIFSGISNREVLKLINKNYGIGETKKAERNDAERKMVLERTRQRYFKPEEQGGGGERARSLLRLGIQWVDIFDIGIGALLTASLYLYEYDFVAPGALAALYGIIIGTVDMVLRKRDPFFPKVVGFILAGVGLYIYGNYFR